MDVAEAMKLIDGRTDLDETLSSNLYQVLWGAVADIIEAVEQRVGTQPTVDPDKTRSRAFCQHCNWESWTMSRPEAAALIARHVANCEKHPIRAVEQERDKLAEFKWYVHRRLDEAGVSADPDSPHKAEGCRIGGRLDEVFAERDELRRESQWVRKKLKLPESTPLFTGGGETLAGTLHVVSHKCDDKQGEIARLTVERNALRESCEEMLTSLDGSHAQVMSAAARMKTMLDSIRTNAEGKSGPNVQPDQLAVLTFAARNATTGRSYRRYLPGNLHPDVQLAVKALVTAGLIESRGRGRSNRLAITDAGLIEYARQQIAKMQAEDAADTQR